MTGSRSWRGALVLLAFLVGLAACQSDTFVVREKEVAGIDNYSWVEGVTSFAGSRVGFGGATTEQAMSFLKAQGFATVVNLRFPDEEGVEIEQVRSAALDAGVRYINQPFDPKRPAAGALDEIIDTLADPRNHPVYIHCSSASRVALVWMIGRYTKDAASIDVVKAEGEKIAGKPQEAVAAFESYRATLQE